MTKFVHLTPPENFSPKVEVVTCFLQVGDKILLLQRNDDKLLGGTWVTPGGKIDADESAKDAIIREMIEETGVVLQEKDLVEVKKVYVRSGPELDISSKHKLIEIDFILHIFKTVLPEYPKTIKLAEQLKKPVLGVIVTRVKKNNFEMQPDVVKDMLEVPILGMVPEHIDIQKSLNLKDAVVHVLPKSKSSRAYKEIAAKILGVDYDSNKDKKTFWEVFKRKFGGG